MFGWCTSELSNCRFAEPIDPPSPFQRAAQVEVGGRPDHAGHGEVSPRRRIHAPAKVGRPGIAVYQGSSLLSGEHFGERRPAGREAEALPGCV